MSDLRRDVMLLLVRELQAFQRELARFPDDESVWQTAPGVTNSAGNLALHLAGNIRHFVGSVLGGTSYSRNRDAEFSRSSGTRAELIAELQAIAVVEQVLPGYPEARLDLEFPEQVMGLSMRTSLFLIHLCAHAGYHLGQADYLRRLLRADGHTVGALSIQLLSDPGFQP